MPVCIIYIDSFSECKNKTIFGRLKLQLISIMLIFIIISDILLISIARTFYILILYSVNLKNFENVLTEFNIRLIHKLQYLLSISVYIIYANVY